MARGLEIAWRRRRDSFRSSGTRPRTRGTRPAPHDRHSATVIAVPVRHPQRKDCRPFCVLFWIIFRHRRVYNRGAAKRRPDDRRGGRAARRVVLTFASVPRSRSELQLSARSHRSRIRTTHARETERRPRHGSCTGPGSVGVLLWTRPALYPPLTLHDRTRPPFAAATLLSAQAIFHVPPDARVPLSDS